MVLKNKKLCILWLKISGGLDSRLEDDGQEFSKIQIMREIRIESTRLDRSLEYWVAPSRGVDLVDDEAEAVGHKS